VYNQYVEPVAVNSVAFSTCGGYVYTGRDKTVNCFPIDRPNAKSSFTLGTKPDNIPKKSIKADYKAKHMLHGIQSTIAPHPKSFYLLATGSYSGQLALLDARLNKIPARVDTAHPRGITQVKWLNEWQILSGARKGDSSIRLWDLRYLDKDNPALDFSVCDYTGSSLEASSLFMRDVQTHQKIEFDVMQNRYVVTGLPSGGYRVFDTKTTEFVSQGVDFKENCDNSSVVSVSVPNYPESDCTKILSVSGERQLPRFDEFVDSDDEGMSFAVPKSSNQIRLDKLNFDLIN
jgi:WD40 repeat protein